MTAGRLPALDVPITALPTEQVLRPCVVCCLLTIALRGIADREALFLLNSMRFLGILQCRPLKSYAACLRRNMLHQLSKSAVSVKSVAVNPRREYINSIAGSAMKYSISVSYSYCDKALLVPVVNLLRQTNEFVFHDFGCIKPGTKWRNEMEAVFNASDVLMIFWCKHATRSQEVHREYLHACTSGKNILVVLLDSHILPDEMSGLQKVDMRKIARRFHVAEPALQWSLMQRVMVENAVNALPMLLIAAIVLWIIHAFMSFTALCTSIAAMLAVAVLLETVVIRLQWKHACDGSYRQRIGLASDIKELLMTVLREKLLHEGKNTPPKSPETHYRGEGMKSLSTDKHRDFGN